MGNLRIYSSLANKKALSYESLFDIPVDSILSVICHPGLFYLYHNYLLMSSIRYPCIRAKKTLTWTGRDSNPHPLGDNQVDYHYPTGPNPARVGLAYQLTSMFSRRIN